MFLDNKVSCDPSGEESRNKTLPSKDNNTYVISRLKVKSPYYVLAHLYLKQFMHIGNSLATSIVGDLLATSVVNGNSIHNRNNCLENNSYKVL